jgi:hypothetical protein
VDPEQSIPLVIAANRDEFYERQGEPAQWREGSPHDYVAPRDPEEGGTWIGINQEGLFVALTNRLERDGSSGSRSRGHLVRELLETTAETSEVDRWLDEEDSRNYGDYSLVAIDGDSLLSQSVNGNQSERAHHESGNFVLSSERGFEWIESGEWDRFPWRTESGREDSDKLRGRLQSFCKQTDSFRHRDAVCRKGEDTGTLSSSIVIIDRSRPELFIDFSQGPPCEAPYRSVDVPSEFKSSVVDNWKLA